MLETSARLLRLLSLLQGRRDWTGAELASRLGVTTRTIRNDVDRLRGLGYPVDARPGVDGGYRSGAGSRRLVEPYRLLNDRRRWYLLAWDLDREAWRTFRVDRIAPRTPTGPRFSPRALPAEDEIAAQVARGIGEATWRYRARVVVHAPADHVRARLPIPVEVRPLGGGRCTFEPGSDHPQMLALYLGLLDADFEVVDSPELVDALRTLADRYRRATAGRR